MAPPLVPLSYQLPIPVFALPQNQPDPTPRRREIATVMIHKYHALLRRRATALMPGERQPERITTPPDCSDWTTQEFVDILRNYYNFCTSSMHDHSLPASEMEGRGKNWWEAERYCVAVAVDMLPDEGGQRGGWMLLGGQGAGARGPGSSWGGNRRVTEAMKASFERLLRARLRGEGVELDE